MVSELISFLQKELTYIYESPELENIIFLLFEENLSWKRTDLVLRRADLIDAKTEAQFLSQLQRLKTSEPVQYVLGKTWFRGLQFIVNSHVLIPRPETEELVEWIKTDFIHDQEKKNLLDIGTGSACIPVSLKKEFPSWNISAIDFSRKALIVAKQNASMNSAEVQFIEKDFLNWSADSIANRETWDILVSNPPYIPVSDRTTIADRVKNFEPSSALFVPDHDPLLFYREIARYGNHFLREKGMIYLEINENFAEQVSMLFSHEGYPEISLRKDMRGKDRLIRIRKK